jgi:hypothetical protein
MLDSLPTSHDVETSAAILRGEAAKLAVVVGYTMERASEVPVWEAPGGGPPAPGAVESAQGYIRVAETLEGLTEPLRAFEAHAEQGGSPYEFLMLMMAEQSAIFTGTDQPQPQEG